MPKHERSQTGCWSCRARKKRCDEGHPECTSCVIRGITCYGYAAKPTWMDGGVQEKRILQEFQIVIKENLRKKRSYVSGSGPFQQQCAPIIQGSPQARPTSPPTPPSTSPSRLPYMGFPHVFNTFSTVSSTDGLADNSDETTLLMQYLDHIFPIQFNCYTPPIAELGRGWLLTLLTRTRPLYHAALAFSAFHMHDVLLKVGRPNCSERHWEMMKYHHELAFRELQVQIEGGVTGLRQCIETVACVLQLIAFELFTGSTNSWRMHLNAAATLFPILVAHLSPTPISTSQQCTPPFSPSAYISRSAATNLLDTRPDNNLVACEFLVGTCIWYDIISTASNLTTPLLHSSTLHLTTIPIELSNIMGCESWAMIIIAQISCLAGSKISGNYTPAEILTRGVDIRQQLEIGLQENMKAMGDPVYHPEASSCQRLGFPQSKIILLLTRIFALSALTYLHTILSSSPSPSDFAIAASVDETRKLIYMIPDPSYMRNLSWPFCVTACMSGEESTKEWEKLMDLAGPETKNGSLKQAWVVVEECWRLRREEGFVGGWLGAIKNLGVEVLLV